MMFERI